MLYILKMLYIIITITKDLQKLLQYETLSVCLINIFELSLHTVLFLLKHVYPPTVRLDK